MFETYTAPALGGRELRVTHTSVKRRYQYASKGTRPFGWRGDRIAVISYNAIGTVASTSGAMTTICETAPRALFVSGSW